MSLRQRMVLTLIGCLISTGIGSCATHREATALPTVIAPAHLEHTPANGQRFCIIADASDLLFICIDANPTDYSWEGLRLGLDDDRYHGEAIWIEISPPVRGPLAVDPEIGGILTINTANGDAPLTVSSNPRTYEQQGGTIELIGVWRTSERMGSRIFELEQVRRLTHRSSSAEETRVGTWSKRAQSAIAAEADRRLDALTEIENETERSLAARRASEALTAVTSAQMALIMVEAHGTTTEREKYLSVIESYAGSRHAWPREVVYSRQ